MCTVVIFLLSVVLTYKNKKWLRLLGTLESIIFIWARRTMLVLNNDEAGFLIDTFELDIDENVLLWWPLTICKCTCALINTCIETSPNVCAGKPCICSVCREHCRAASAWLCYIQCCIPVMGWSRQFFCLVKTKNNVMFELWAILGGLIFTWACGMTSA